LCMTAIFHNFGLMRRFCSNIAKMKLQSKSTKSLKDGSLQERTRIFQKTKLTPLVKSNQSTVNDMLNLMREARSEKIADLEMYTSVLKFVKLKGDSHHCEEVLEAFMEDEISPDVLFYNLQFKGLDIIGAEQLLEKMQLNSVNPDSVTYTTLMRAASDSGDLVKTIHYFNLVQKLGQVSPISWSTYISSFIKNNKMDQAQRLYLVMVDDLKPRNEKPEFALFSNFVLAFAASGEVEDALKWLRKRQDLKVRARRTNPMLQYNAILRALQEAGQFEDFDALFSEAVHYGHTAGATLPLDLTSEKLTPVVGMAMIRQALNELRYADEIEPLIIKVREKTLEWKGRPYGLTKMEVMDLLKSDGIEPPLKSTYDCNTHQLNISASTLSRWFAKNPD